MQWERQFKNLLLTERARGCYVAKVHPRGIEVLLPCESGYRSGRRYNYSTNPRTITRAPLINCIGIVHAEVLVVSLPFVTIAALQLTTSVAMEYEES